MVNSPSDEPQYFAADYGASRRIVNNINTTSTQHNTTARWAAFLARLRASV
jgi:hypothetical protein